MAVLPRLGRESHFAPKEAGRPSQQMLAQIGHHHLLPSKQLLRLRPHQCQGLCSFVALSQHLEPLPQLLVKQEIGMVVPTVAAAVFPERT